MKISNGDVSLLMYLQYNFLLTPDPYSQASDHLKVPLEKLLKRLRELKSIKLLKRIGYYVNYRSVGRSAALVAFASEGKWRDIDQEIKLEVTHSYLRDHPKYNLWVVIKGKNQEEIKREVDLLAKKFGVSYLILPSKRTLRLSVKYDLIKGVSRAGSYNKVSLSPPSPEEFGLTSTLLWELRSLPLEERPYKKLANKCEYSEEGFLDLVKEMLESGVLRDPGASLSGRMAGFLANGMVLLGNCGPLLKHQEFTHIVEREVSKGWPYSCYGMIHSRNKEIIQGIVKDINNSLVLYSLVDLRPEAVR